MRIFTFFTTTKLMFIHSVLCNALENKTQNLLINTLLIKANVHCTLKQTQIILFYTIILICFRIIVV